MYQHQQIWLFVVQYSLFPEVPAPTNLVVRCSVLFIPWGTSTNKFGCSLFSTLYSLRYQHQQIWLFVVQYTLFPEAPAPTNLVVRCSILFIPWGTSTNNFGCSLFSTLYSLRYQHQQLWLFVVQYSLFPEVPAPKTVVVLCSVLFIPWGTSTNNFGCSLFSTLYSLRYQHQQLLLFVVQYSLFPEVPAPTTFVVRCSVLFIPWGTSTNNFCCSLFSTLYSLRYQHQQIWLFAVHLALTTANRTHLPTTD